MNESIIDHGET